MPEEDTKIPQLKPHYFRGKLDNHFEKFVEVVRRLSINMPLLDALQGPTYSRYYKDILANKYEIATLGVDHVKMSERCSVAIANGLEKQKTSDARQFHVPLVHSSLRRYYATLEQVSASCQEMCSRSTYHWSLRVCAWSWVITPFAIPWASPKM
jgi:hypothetical protein